MGRVLDALFGKRTAASPTPLELFGFPTTGGVFTSVTATTAIGLSSVWRCLDILSNGVSQLPWQERQGTLDLPLSPLLRRPQQDYTRREWVSVVVSTLALYDVCYLLKAGEDAEGVPVSLIYVDPRIVAPKTSDIMGVLPPQQFYIGRELVDRDRLVILHRSPQPGISEDAGGVIRLARITFAAALAAEGYASRYWQAGGSPTTVLEADGKIDDTLAQTIAERWATMRALGPDYPATLGSGLKAKDFGADPTQQAAVEARREQVADIGRYFGIPTRILNAPTGDSETYTSTSAANMDLVRYTLQNYIGAIEDAFTDLLPAGRSMTMDTWRLTAGTQIELAQAFQLATGGKAWLGVDEVRERIGYGPVEDPDELNPAPQPVTVGGTENG